MKHLILLVFFLFISTSAIAQLNPQLYENNPVVPIGPTGTWDDSALWWPNVTVVSDTFYVIYNGNDNWPVNPASLGLATSTDGYTFTKSASNPILTPDGNGFDTHSVDDGMLYFENDTWYLYYGGRSSSPNQPGNVIGRATASNPHGPWNRTNDTLLTIGSAGEWDDEFLSPCTILPTDTGLVMYYWAGEAWPNAKPQIGMATSIDGGVTWKKYNNPATTEKPYTESDPVLRPADYESYDDAGIWGCSVLKLEGEWQMFYGGDSDGYTSICYATSENGIVWEKYENNPVLNPPQDPLASSTLNGPAAVIWNSTYFVCYSYGVNDIGISVATSSRYLNVPTNYPTIQGAINTAVDGDIVLVDEGTYYENINFKGKAITVASQFIMDQDTSHISKTIIDGSQHSHPDSGSVVIFQSGEDTTSVLCGFTITGGTGTEWPDDPAGLTTALRCGGGILIQFAGAKICHNIIKNNIIDNEEDAMGAGIGAGYLADPKWVVIENNEIYNNHLASNNWAKGSGICAAFNSIKIINNEVHHNTVKGNSDDFFAGAAGIWYSNRPDSSKTVIISGNLISKNKVTHTGNYTAAVWGSGLVVWNMGGYSLVSNNVIQNNESNAEKIIFGNGVMLNFCKSVDVLNNTIISNTFSGGQECRGGGICINSCSPVMIKNIIADNVATHGGGIFSGKYDKTYPKIINNTIVNNNASAKGGGIYYHYSYPKLMNSILWNNSAPSGSQIYRYSGSINVTYSDVEGGYSGVGNIDANPYFCTDTLYCLSDSSQCIDSGDPSCVDPENPDDLGYPLWPAKGTLRSDMGAYGGYELVVGINYDFVSTPSEFLLFQNYPNPFNPTTTISYQLSAVSDVELSIYNILGQKVAALVNAKQNSGMHTVQWNAAGFASGVYMYRLSTGSGPVAGSGHDFSQIKKLILLK
ncbi:MAG: T9SS type A sorting domain-containing protein [Calditrichia bacterium]|nr:T9SS type A sorting domain-containing protein [Calditrichia bacterium]